MMEQAIEQRTVLRVSPVTEQFGGRNPKRSCDLEEMQDPEQLRTPRSMPLM